MGLIKGVAAATLATRGREKLWGGGRGGLEGNGKTGFNLCTKKNLHRSRVDKAAPVREVGGRGVVFFPSKFS